MDIKPQEVESVTTIGNLHGNDVKLVKCVGGFYVAVGKKKKDTKKAEALAAGSHSGIVAHQICKEYGSDFKPALAKSEHDKMAEVEDKTSHLPSNVIQNGVELYTLTKGSNLEFILYKQGITLAKYDAEIENNNLVIKKHEYRYAVEPNKKVALAISKAMKDKVYELKLSEIKR